MSDAFRDFVSLCLRKDPYTRPPAEHLLTHPWIKWAKDQRTDDVANFVAPFLDPRERVRGGRFLCLVSAPCMKCLALL